MPSDQVDAPEPESLCDACGRAFPQHEISECDRCGMVACDECRMDRCCKMDGFDAE